MREFIILLVTLKHIFLLANHVALRFPYFLSLELLVVLLDLLENQLFSY